MQDLEKLREIDALGEEELPPEELWEPEDQEPKEASGGWGGVPLLQAVLCALAILTMVFLQITDRQKYQEIAQWYRGEMSQEIQLPDFRKSEPEPSPSPEPSPVPEASAPQQQL